MAKQETEISTNYLREIQEKSERGEYKSTFAELMGMTGVRNPLPEGRRTPKKKT